MKNIGDSVYTKNNEESLDSDVFQKKRNVGINVKNKFDLDYNGPVLNDDKNLLMDNRYSGEKKQNSSDFKKIDSAVQSVLELGVQGI